MDCYLAYLAPFQGQTAISVENRQFSLPRVYIAPAGIGYRPRAPQNFNPALVLSHSFLEYRYIAFFSQGPHWFRSLCQGGYVSPMFVCWLAGLRKNSSIHFHKSVERSHTGHRRDKQCWMVSRVLFSGCHKLEKLISEMTQTYMRRAGN